MRDLQQAASYKPQSGFTLVEVLVVVLLIGIVSSYVMLSTESADKTRLATPIAKKIQNSFYSASRQAILSGYPVGAVVRPKELVFIRYGQKGWFQDEEKGQLRTVKLPNEWNFSTMKPTGEILSDQLMDQAEQIQPQLLFFADGSMTDIRINLLDENSITLLTVQVDSTSEIQILITGEQYE